MSSQCLTHKSDLKNKNEIVVLDKAESETEEG